MSIVNITNIRVLNNPSLFQTPFSLEITLECFRDLPDVLDWKLIYVGSAREEMFDQELDNFSLGPLQSGIMQFTVESNYPDFTKIPSKEDLIGVTALIISVSYKKKEFFRCGYYVYNNYYEQELIENDPSEVMISRVMRNILSDKPRITRFDINWEIEEEIDNTACFTESGSYVPILKETTNFPQNYGLNNITSGSDSFQKPQQASFMSNAGFMGFSNNIMGGGYQIANPFANSGLGVFEQLSSIPSFDSSMNMYGGLYGENIPPNGI